VSVQARKLPAALSDSCCNAASWARVETLAYPRQLTHEDALLHNSTRTTLATHWFRTPVLHRPLPRPHGKAVPGGGVCQNRSSAARSPQAEPRVTPPRPVDGLDARAVFHIRSNETRSSSLPTPGNTRLGDTSLREAGPTVEHWRSKMTALGTDIADAAWQTIHRDSIVDELTDTTVPVLAIAGAEDHAYPPPVSDEHIATATGGRSVTLEAAGHSVALEQPDQVADLLLEHFAAASRAAGTSG